MNTLTAAVPAVSASNRKLNLFLGVDIFAQQNGYGYILSHSGTRHILHTHTHTKLVYRVPALLKNTTHTQLRTHVQKHKHATNNRGLLIWRKSCNAKLRPSLLHSVQCIVQKILLLLLLFSLFLFFFFEYDLIRIMTTYLIFSSGHFFNVSHNASLIDINFDETKTKAVDHLLNKTR